MKTKRTVLLGMLIAISLVLGYVEFSLPNFVPIPGIKLGLANIPVMYALFKLKPIHTFTISIIRVTIISLAFGNLLYFAFSLAGAFCSILVMIILKKLQLFSLTGISICGGVCHNLGQIIIAVIVLDAPGLFYYFPFLLIAGIVAGIIIGLISKLLIERVKLPFAI